MQNGLLRQSFVPGEITPEEANRLGCELAKRFTKGNHAYIVCTHIDKAHIHNHKAAKQHFDELGVKKLPTIKALNTEYAALMAEKKAAYAEYRKAREDMKELLTAKANIDRILELDEEQLETKERREKEAEQR